MHSAAFNQVGFNGVYVALRVTDAAGAVAGLRSLGVAGASVTIPHKRAVIEELDEVDPTAAAIGAVNTIVNVDGRLSGHNTDGVGAVRALQKKCSLAGKRVAVIGAGGTARAVAHTAKAQGAGVTIVNRTAARGEALAQVLGADFQALADFKGRDIDVLINTTSVGMHPARDAMVIDEALLNARMVVMDVVYNPLHTRLLRCARQKGCQTVDGLAMFVEQGASQFELWTGQKAPLEVMDRVAREAMAGLEGAR
jgi:shikimate dehydrogenase